MWYFQKQNSKNGSSFNDGAESSKFKLESSFPIGLPSVLLSGTHVLTCKRK